MIPHSCFPSLFVAVNNYLPCPFVSRELVEIWIGLFELLNVVMFLHHSGVLWVLWSRRMKKFSGRCLRLAKNGLNCSLSAGLLVCTADCSSLFHSLQTSLAQRAYETAEDEQMKLTSQLFFGWNIARKTRYKRWQFECLCLVTLTVLRFVGLTPFIAP